MKKTIIICSVVLALLICAGAAVSVVLGTAAIRKADGVNSRLAEVGSRVDEIAGFAGFGEDVAQENDVTIAGEYVIKSTENISDAYKSGDRDSLSDKERETLDMAAEILGEIVTDDMDDYEKELAVYKWMTSNLESDEGMLTVIPQTQADCDNPYGVLKYHNAVCVGYATTFRLFMQMMDIPCKVVHNSEMYHSWDLVNLGGNWYHTDIYSDVGVGSYAHFNLTDDMMSSQNWNRDFFPAADSLEYCYLFRNAVRTTDVCAIPAALRELIDGEKETASFLFPGGLSNAEAALVEETLNTLSSLVGDGEEGYAFFDWNWAASGDDYLLSVVYVTDTWDEPDYEDLIDENDRKKMQKSIVEAFGDLFEIDTDDTGWYGGYDWYGSYYDYARDGMFEIPTDEEFGALRDAYADHLLRDCAETPEEAENISVSRWYGTFGGMQALMFDGFAAADAEREETVAGSTLRFANGNSIVITDGTSFFSLGEAYEYGLLDKKQIAMIAEIQNEGYYFEVNE